tara:strand:+ start:166 stop:447 length:282 start_codon:yes stop_codon:yes gene_type:complete
MIDTDKYMYEEEAKKIVQDAGLINECDGFLDVHYKSIAHLLTENKRLREELKQTRESLWWCYDNYRFDGHPMVDADWDFIGNLLGVDMESDEE